MAETNGGFVPGAEPTPADKALKDSGDINKVHVPYVRQDFPRLLYKAHLCDPVRYEAQEGGGRARVGVCLPHCYGDLKAVADAKALSDALADGWSVDPVPMLDPEASDEPAPAKAKRAKSA